VIIWLVFVVLIFIALAFILPPLWQSSAQTQKDSHHGRTEANVGVYRDQLSELEMDLRNGIVGPEQYQQDRDEIERRLLEDVSISEPTTRPSGGDKRRLAFALALAFPLVAVSFYLAVGNPKAISPEAAAVTPAVAGTGTNEFSQQRIEANVASLAKRLADNPSDGPGWVMLARSYSSMEKYREADDAFAKATALVTNDADLWAEYAFANAMANGRQLQGKPLELVNKALKLDPENLKGLELAGSAAFQAKDYKQAIEYWQRLLSKVPADSEVAESVKQRLEEAKSLAKPK
jgi:cytochrome c-type biogenesis protein CcmH